MRAEHRWVKQRVLVNRDDWTPIAPPLDFDYFGLRCDTSRLTLRTDVADESTEDTLEQNLQDGVMGAFSIRFFHTLSATQVFCRFKKDVPVCYVKSAAVSATVIVTWVL